jgi:NAD(P)-dependent dehydrogenase (short-subunit alcohol dehydrogenase family)
VTADIAAPEGVADAVDSAVSAFGRLDHVHANAAVRCFGDVLECTTTEWDTMFAVNLRGVFLLTQPRRH